MSEENKNIVENVGGRGCGGDAQTKGGIDDPTCADEGQPNIGERNEPETQETGEPNAPCQ